MNKQLLKNERITLRAIEPEDIDIVYDMENDTGFWKISNTTIPYSRNMLKQYIDNSQNDLFIDRQLHLIIVSNEENNVLGSVNLSDFSPLNSHAAVGILIKEKYRRKGYGKDALNLLIDYSFKILHINQLYAYIAANNTQSLKLFRSCGFTESGILKQWLREENGYSDVCFLQKISTGNGILL